VWSPGNLTPPHEGHLMFGFGKKKDTPLSIPNLWALIMMMEAEQMMSSLEFGSLQKALGQTGPYPTHTPSNMKKEFPFEQVALIHKTIRETQGDSGAQVYGLRVGHRIVDDSLNQFKSVAQAAKVAMSVGSRDAKVKIGLEFFSKFFDSVSDETIVASEDAAYWTWSVTRCAACLGQHADRPMCYIHVGLVEGVFGWIVPQVQFNIFERECIAAGGYACVIGVQKQAL
jgi:predicted hydrocarbon binding protein